MRTSRGRPTPIICASAAIHAGTSSTCSCNPIYVLGAVEEWRDWDGSSVGSGPVKLDLPELKQRYGARLTIT